MSSEPVPSLRREQWELLDALVEAERRRAARGDRRATFAVIYADQATMIQHPDLGLAGGLPDVSEGDIRALLDAGLLEASGSETLLQVSGFGEETYLRRHSGVDPRVRERDTLWRTNVDQLAARIGSLAGSLAALVLIAVFAVATALSIEDGSAPGAGLSLVVLVISLFSFANTAFEIGPITVGRRFGGWLGARIARWLHQRLDPPLL